MLSSAFQRRVNRLSSAINKPARRDIIIDKDTKTFTVVSEFGQSVTYRPTKTGLKFHESPDFIRGMIGPYGSGKTTAMIAEIIFQTCGMPRLPDGTRSSRWIVVRNTYGELESTTYVSWMAWFGELGKVHRSKKPILTVRHEFNDGDGDINLEVVFLALDSESDIRKLKSLEVSGIYVNEASEIEKAVLEHGKGRLRYLMNNLPDYRKCIIFDTNPPNDRHWIYDTFERQKLASHGLFHQPSGLLKDESNSWVANKEADNVERLGMHYYLNMTHGATEEFIKVYCLGEYGTVLNGKKVYPEYNDDIHAIETIHLQDSPIYIGMDFGLTPSAIIIQETAKGTYNVVHELTSEFLGVKQFIDNILRPFLSRHCSEHEIGAIIGDPAGDKKNENDLTSCFDILHEEGFMIQGSSTNLIPPRLEAVRHTLTTLVEGQPKILVSKEGCPLLRDGFLGAYNYKKIKALGEEVYDNKPLKNEYSHIQDALQYIILYLNSQSKISHAQKTNTFMPQPMRI